jgi:putative ABC transport system permease protein
MTSLRRLFLRLVNVFRPDRAEPELARELDAHLALLADDFERRGMTPVEAQIAARRAFGGVEQTKDLHRDARSVAWLDDVRRDVRYAARTLRQRPGFTVVAVLTLAVGIGVNAVVFTVTNAVLFKGFPLVDGNDRLFYMTSAPGCCVSYPDFEDWRAQARSFEGMALVHGVPIVFSDGSGFPERYDATEVSADTFRLTGQRPILGRDFTPADETPGAAPVAILRHGFWESRFGKAPDIIGRRVWLNGVATTVIGVMPPGFSFPQNQDLWVPLVPTADVRRRDVRNTWFVLGRLADGVSIESARAEMETIGRRLGRDYPLTNQGRNLIPHVLDFEEFFIGPSAATIYRAMWGAVGFVLLIACANLANLLLARAIERSREMSVRIAIGAGRWRIVRQLLIESVMLSAIGGLAGWWIATWGVRLYGAAVTGPGLSGQINGTWFNGVLDYSMDYRVFAYLAAISIGTGLLFGLAPASRLFGLDVNAALRDGGRSGGGGGRRHLSGVLVAGEMALAVVLLAGAGLTLRSYLNVYNAGLGFRSENLATALISLPNLKYPDAEAQVSFYDRLLRRLETLPGVASVAIASSPPAWSAALRPYELAGALPLDDRSRPAVMTLTIGAGYFQTLGAAVISGREFGDADAAAAVSVAIVNQTFASRHWPGENPVGKRLRLFTRTMPDAWLTVVGVAPDIAQNRTLQDLDPLVYLAYPQRPAADMWVIARTAVPPATLATAFRREVQVIDAALPIADGPIPLAERLARAYQYRGIVAALFMVFAVVALLLASVGLYAVVAHSVSQRTQEIGVRTALGATARDIVGLVLRQGMLPFGIGLAVGLPASLAVNRVLQGELVQVSPADPVTFAVASAVLIAAAILGCVIPARRAMRVDPVVALRR